MLGTLLLYEISYETMNARNYAHTFARLDIQKDNAGVHSAFPGSDERTLEDMRCDVIVVSRSIFLSAHNRHARRYKNNEYRRAVIQCERHDVHVSEITRFGLVITTECKNRAGGPATADNYSAAQFTKERTYICIFVGDASVSDIFLYFSKIQFFKDLSLRFITYLLPHC